MPKIGRDTHGGGQFEVIVYFEDRDSIRSWVDLRGEDAAALWNHVTAEGK